MPTPLFSFRLSEKSQQTLADVAKLCGAPSTSAFAREILETVCSGDVDRISAFHSKLLRGMTQQMTLQLEAAAKPPRPKRGGRRAKRR